MGESRSKVIRINQKIYHKSKFDIFCYFSFDIDERSDVSGSNTHGCNDNDWMPDIVLVNIGSVRHSVFGGLLP